MAFPTDWGRRCALVIQSSQVTDNETDFPVLITEDTLPSEIFDADGSYPALNGGGDIRFSSDEAGNTQLACEIEKFVTDNNPANGKAAIWVKVPSVSSSSNTTIYIWYNKAGESQPAEGDAYGKHAVWDANFKMVQHMNQTPTGSAGDIVDSTSNSNDGTTYNMNSDDQVAGQIDGSLDFDGSGDYVTTDSAIETLNNFTISGWFYPRANNNQDYIWSLGYNDADSFLMFKGIDNELRYYPYNRAVIQTTGMYLTINAWQHIVIKRDGGTITAYLDMASDAKSVDAYAINDKFELAWAVARNNPADYFNGKIDEVRISNVARSAGWIATEYNNQKTPSTFVIEGTPESPSALAFTSNASLKKEISATFVGNANLKSIEAITFTGDSNLKKEISDTFISDSNLKSEETVTFTGDVNLKKEEISATFTSDASLESIIAITFTGDTNLKKEVSTTFTSNSNLKSSETTIFTGDSNLKKEILATLTGDAHLIETEIITFTGNASLKSVEAFTFTSDASLKSVETITFTSDTNLKKEVSTTFTGDSNLKDEISATFTGNASLKSIETATFTGNASLKIVIVTTFIGVANLKSIEAAIFTSNANLKAIETTTSTGDSNLKKEISAAFTGDSYFESAIVASFTGNASLKSIEATVFVGDSSLEKEIATTFTGNASLKSIETITFTGNSNLKSTETNVFTGDANLKATDVSAIFTGDANMKTVESATFTGDSSLEAIIISATFTSNAKLTKIILIAFTGDASLNISTTFTGDSNLRKTSVAGFAGIIIVDNKQQTYGYGFPKGMEFPIK